MLDQESEENSEINDPENVTISADGQLSYIGQDIEEIPAGLVKNERSRVVRLDLSFNCLRSLKGLGSFTNLEEVILDNNELGEDIEFPYMRHLTTLSLNKNNLRNLDRLLREVKEHMQALTFLSLLGNHACPNQLSNMENDEEDYHRYRLYVLYHLPQLKFLDSTQVRESERQEASKYGPFLAPVRPAENLLNKDQDAAQESDVQKGYTPLPQSLRVDDDHKSSFGKCKYVYYGKHSEGNRFIRNQDL